MPLVGSITSVGMIWLELYKSESEKRSLAMPRRRRMRHNADFEAS